MFEFSSGRGGGTGEGFEVELDRSGGEDSDESLGGGRLNEFDRMGCEGRKSTCSHCEICFWILVDVGRY